MVTYCCVHDVAKIVRNVITRCLLQHLGFHVITQHQQFARNVDTNGVDSEVATTKTHQALSTRIMSLR